MLQTADLARVRRCACGNIRRTTRALTQYYDDKLKSTGLHTTQLTLLVNIGLEASVTITQLAELLLIDQTTLTRNLKLLKAQELVESIAGHDQRTRLWTLTDKGKAILEVALPLWQEAQAHIVEGMGKERYYSLLKELSALAALTE